MNYEGEKTFIIEMRIDRIIYCDGFSLFIFVNRYSKRIFLGRRIIDILELLEILYIVILFVLVRDEKSRYRGGDFFDIRCYFVEELGLRVLSVEIDLIFNSVIFVYNWILWFRRELV